MTETKFTPGPWKVGHGGWIIKDGDRQDNRWGISHIANVPLFALEGLTNNKRSYNSHLIAAAPDLYEALKHCEDLLTRYSISTIHRADHERIENDALRIIRSALQKARGETE